MADETLIRRVFTRAENGAVHMEEVWDTTEHQDGRFSPMNPTIRRKMFSSYTYAAIRAVTAEYIEHGEISPEAAARTVFI